MYEIISTSISVFSTFCFCISTNLFVSGLQSVVKESAFHLWVTDTNQRKWLPLVRKNKEVN